MRDLFLFGPIPTRNRRRELSRSQSLSVFLSLSLSPWEEWDNDKNKPNGKFLSINSRRGWSWRVIGLRWVSLDILEAISLPVPTIRPALTIKLEDGESGRRWWFVVTELILRPRRRCEIIKTRFDRIKRQPSPLAIRDSPFEIQRARWKVKEHYPSSRRWRNVSSRTKKRKKKKRKIVNECDSRYRDMALFEKRKKKEKRKRRKITEDTLVCSLVGDRELYACEAYDIRW